MTILWVRVGDSTRDKIGIELDLELELELELESESEKGLELELKLELTLKLEIKLELEQELELEHFEAIPLNFEVIPSTQLPLIDSYPHAHLLTLSLCSIL